MAEPPIPGGAAAVRESFEKSATLVAREKRR
jgi:hypothetical protein